MKSIRDVKYYIEKEKGCHIPKRQPCVWHESNKGDNGYVLLSLCGERVRAHRESYMHYKGIIPEGMIVMHSCDNRECINPDHLVLGSKRDNTQDMVSKGRAVGGGTKKLTPEQVQEIKDSPLSSYKLAEIYPVSSTHIRRIKNGTRHNKAHKQRQYKPNKPLNSKEKKALAVEIYHPDLI